MLRQRDGTDVKKLDDARADGLPVPTPCDDVRWITIVPAREGAPVRALGAIGDPANTTVSWPHSPVFFRRVRSMNWRIFVKRCIPPSVLNRVLLAFPFLYHTKFVNLESNIRGRGMQDLRSQLDLVLGLKGNIIECGSSRCGTSITIAYHLRAKGCAKSVYAYDSFEGFDQNELRRERASGFATAPDKSFTSTSYRYVQAKLARLAVDDIVLPVKGFFQSTLPHLNSEFCFALVDCDLRDSLVYCAEAIWPHLVGGGRILFDDYKSAEYRGARLGVEYFVEKYQNQIEEHGLLKQLYYVVKKTSPAHDSQLNSLEKPGK
jgi:O-methyltransferase